MKRSRCGFRGVWKLFTEMKPAQPGVLTLEKLNAARAMLEAVDPDPIICVHLRPGALWYEYRDRCEYSGKLTAEQARTFLAALQHYNSGLQYL